MIIYTVGTFDLLHVGHIALLEYCKSLGDVLAVGVASDRVVNSYKPNVPVIPLEQRMEMLRALRCVDIVRSYDELEYVSGCKELNAEIFVIGEDWGNNPHNLAVESYLKSSGKQIKQDIGLWLVGGRITVRPISKLTNSASRKVRMIFSYYYDS